MAIIEDTGEKSDHIRKALERKGIAVEIEEIRFADEDEAGDPIKVRCGDYTNTNRDFIAELKKDRDHLQSLNDGRFYAQLERMYRYLPNKPKYLIFQGDWNTLVAYAAKKKLHHKLIASRLRCIAFGVNWINTKDANETAKLLVSMDKYCKGNINFEVGFKPTFLHRSIDERLRLLTLVIGQSKAKLLLDKYENVYTVVKMCMNSGKEVGKDVKGIGPKSIEKIANYFTNKESTGKDGKLNPKPGSPEDRRRISKLRKRSQYYFLLL